MTTYKQVGTWQSLYMSESKLLIAMFQNDFEVAEHLTVKCLEYHTYLNAK